MIPASSYAAAFSMAMSLSREGLPWWIWRRGPPDAGDYRIAVEGEDLGRGWVCVAVVGHREATGKWRG